MCGFDRKKEVQISIKHVGMTFKEHEGKDVKALHYCFIFIRFCTRSYSQSR